MSETSLKGLAERTEYLDDKIQDMSRSASAPRDFMENELRRQMNRYVVFFPHVFLGDDKLEHTKDILEKEYACYFNPAEFQKDLRPGFWKAVYAGCNAQIEFFLRDNGLEEGLTAINDSLTSESFTLENNKLNDNLRRYLVGIGYLYPRGDESIVHPNFFMANFMPFRYSSDSAFLTRDLIRCPYHEAQGSHDPLTDDKMWHYWTELVSMTLGGAGNHESYPPYEYKEGTMRPEIQLAFELGRRLVPKRYIELEPRIEKFDWVIPIVSDT